MIRLLAFIALFLFASAEAFAQKYWSFEAHGGQVLNVPLPLTIRQEGFPDLHLTARYRAESFVLPVYWDLRLARWVNSKAFELEVIHHKLYLDNTTHEVEKFNISHGFNLIMVNRAIGKNHWRYRLGGGLVLAHPESKIRGQSFGDSNEDFDTSYFAAGPVINLAAGRPVNLGRRFYLDLEAKITAAYANIKIAQGNSEVYNLAIHLVAGPGFRFAASH